jgi:hypothetical protein
MTKKKETEATEATTANIRNVSKLEGDAVVKTVDVPGTAPDAATPSIAAADASVETHGQNADASVETHGQNADAAPEPNVRYVGAKRAPKVITVGKGEYLVPGVDDKAQRAGFNHPEADAFAALPGGLYEAI